MFNSILDAIIDLFIIHLEIEDGAKEYYCEFRKKDLGYDTPWCFAHCIPDDDDVADYLPWKDLDPNDLDPAKVSDILAGYTEEGERYLSITYRG